MAPSGRRPVCGRHPPVVDGRCRFSARLLPLLPLPPPRPARSGASGRMRPRPFARCGSRHTVCGLRRTGRPGRAAPPSAHAACGACFRRHFAVAQATAPHHAVDHPRFSRQTRPGAATPRRRFRFKFRPEAQHRVVGSHPTRPSPLRNRRRGRRSGQWVIRLGALAPIRRLFPHLLQKRSTDR